MKKFKFRFESILKQRKSAEESALKQLALAQRAYQAQLIERSRLNEVLAEALKSRQELGKTSTLVSRYKTVEDHIIGTKQRLIQNQQSVSRALRVLEKALRAFLQARREAQAMETLRDKELAEFKKEIVRRERKEHDDLATMRARFSESLEEGENSDNLDSEKSA